MMIWSLCLQTVTEADIRKRPMWHTYPGPRPPAVAQRPEALGPWKAMPREEHKVAGVGWLGRGRGGAAGAAVGARQIESSSYGGRARGSGGSGYGRGSHGVDGGRSRGGRFDGGGEYGFGPGRGWAGGGGGGAPVRQTAEGRPVGVWARGGGGRT